jgi:hypothetical protein
LIPDGSAPHAPLNAMARCMWPLSTFAESRLSARFTPSGLAIHHVAAILSAYKPPASIG